VARTRRRRSVLLAVLAGTTIVIVPTRIVPPGWPPVGWVVVACDVGQGDALVLATARPGWGGRGARRPGRRADRRLPRAPRSARHRPRAAQPPARRPRRRPRGRAPGAAG